MIFSRIDRHHKPSENLRPKTKITGRTRTITSTLTVLLLPSATMTAWSFASLGGSMKDVRAAVWKELSAGAQRRAFSLGGGRAHGDERCGGWRSSHCRLQGAGSGSDTWGMRLEGIKIENRVQGNQKSHDQYFTITLVSHWWNLRGMEYTSISASILNHDWSELRRWLIDTDHRFIVAVVTALSHKVFFS